MKSTLKFLANPLYTGGIAFLFALAISDHNLQPEEYITVSPFLFLFFSLPFMIMSSITRRQLDYRKKEIRLVGLWIGSVSASLIWTASIIFSDNPQAGLGFINMPVVSIGGGVVGYLTFWLSAKISELK